MGVRYVVSESEVCVDVVSDKWVYECCRVPGDVTGRLSYSGKQDSPLQALAATTEMWYVSFRSNINRFNKIT